MPTGLSSSTTDALLTLFLPSTWVQLHVGEPGADGSKNPAGETRRQEAPMAATGPGAIETSADVTWLAVTAAETYTHASYWDAETGGVFRASDKLPGTDSRRTVKVGDNFRIPAGEIGVGVKPVAS